MEALAIVGLASSVVQFVQFGSLLCKEIHEYSSAFGRAPQKITDIERRVSLILTTLADVEDDGKAELDQERRTIEDCNAKIEELLVILDTWKLTSRPLEGKATCREWLHRSLNRMEMGWKAFKVLHGDVKIEALQLSLDRLLDLLGLQLQIKANRKLDGCTEAIIRRIESLDFDVRQEQKVYEQAGERGIKHVIPFVRNVRFIGREEIIKKLEEKFSLGEPQVALCGLGGVGKTQIALEYAIRLKERLPSVSVFWVFASNKSRFEDAYKRIASICGIPGHRDPNANLLQIVHDWLERTYPCKWLMVVDNVDNASDFFEMQLLGKSMYEYVPQSPNGIVLYTTRNRDIAIDLASDQDPIHVGFLSTEEADQLLDKYVRDASTSDERLEFLQALDYLPLAITQAVAFMAKRRKSIAQYLELFEKSDAAKARLLNYEFIDHGREARALDSVARTWMISFNLIKSNHPRAADSLSLMSFLDPQSVHPSLLPDDGEDEWDLFDALEVLLAFSLIKINGSDGTYSMHRLVQIVTCSWLASSNAGYYDKYAMKALYTLAKRLPDNFIENTAASVYFPHADKVLASEIKRTSLSDKLNQAILLHKTAKYYCSSGHLIIAEARAKQAHSIRTETLGRFHPDTIVSLISLGWINNRLRQYSVTRDTIEPVLGILIEKGTFPIGLMRELANVLAQALISQNQLDSAERLIRSVLPDHFIDNLAASILQKPSHDDLESYRLIVALGRRYLRGSAYEVAEDHYQKALTLYQKAFVKCSVDTDNASQTMMGSIRHGISVTTEGLALVLSHQGRDEKAEVLYRELLAERESTYGSRGFSTLVTLNHLARALGKQEKWEEAEAVWQRVCRDSEVVLGLGHRDTLRNQQSYANLQETKSERMWEASAASTQGVLDADL